MDEHDVAWQAVLGQLDQVPVVGKEQDLGVPRQFGQGPEARPGAVVVEVQEDVVDDERDRLVGLEPRLETGQPQRQVELVLASRCSSPRHRPAGRRAGPP